MASVKISKLQFESQPGTLFAQLKTPISMTVNGVTNLKLKLTEKPGKHFEIELVD
jgi:hypothetical protein